MARFLHSDVDVSRYSSDNVGVSGGGGLSRDDDSVSDVHTMDGTETLSGSGMRHNPASQRLYALGGGGGNAAQQQQATDAARFHAEVAAEQERVAREFGLAPTTPHTHGGSARGKPPIHPAVTNTTSTSLMAIQPKPSHSDDDDSRHPRHQYHNASRPNEPPPSLMTNNNHHGTDEKDDHEPLYPIGIPALNVTHDNDPAMLDYDEISGIYSHAHTLPHMATDDEYSLDAIAYENHVGADSRTDATDADETALKMFLPLVTTPQYHHVTVVGQLVLTGTWDDGQHSLVPSVYTQTQMSLDPSGPAPFLSGRPAPLHNYTDLLDDDANYPDAAPQYIQPVIDPPTYGMNGQPPRFDDNDYRKAQSSSPPAIPANVLIVGTAAGDLGTARNKSPPVAGSLPPYQQLDTTTTFAPHSSLARSSGYPKYGRFSRVITALILVLVAAIAIAVGSIVAANNRNESSSSESSLNSNVNGSTEGQNGAAAVSGTPTPSPRSAPVNAPSASTENTPTTPSVENDPSPTVVPVATPSPSVTVKNDKGSTTVPSTSPRPTVPRGTTTTTSAPSMIIIATSLPVAAATSLPVAAPAPCTVPDTVGVDLYINERQGFQNCQWLSTRPFIVATICLPGSEPFQLCPFTCGQCVVPTLLPTTPPTLAPVISATPVTLTPTEPFVISTVMPVLPTTAAPVVPATAAPVVLATVAPVTEAPVIPMTAAPVAPPVADRFTIFGNMILAVSPGSANVLADSTTSQWAALNWLANVDQLDKSPFSETRIVERWAMAAVVGYGLGYGGILASTDVCSWVGTSCTSDGLVSSISLTGVGLTGSILPAIYLLGSLNVLDFEVNNISGTIPDAIGSLGNLQTLRLANNDISGTIPSSLGNLSILSVLDLQRNELTGSVPSSLVSLGGTLTSLLLNTNRLSGEFPPALCDYSSTLEIELDCLEVVIDDSCWERCFYQCGGVSGIACPDDLGNL